MHPDRSFAWTNEDALLDFVRQSPFVRLFAQTPVGPRVAHLPVLVGDGCVRFHLANRNALTPHLTGAVALIVAEGPNGYVSANWYADGRQAVPTWNYIAVEIEGPVRRLDRAALITLVDEQANDLEPRVGEDWTRAKLDPTRFDALLNAITGFELRITALRGTRKLSQNKAGAELAAVLNGLDRSRQQALAQAVRDLQNE